MSQNIILNHQEIEHKIRRIAFQILETFVDDGEIVLAGIADNGFILAQKINLVLKEISSIEVTLCKVKIEKQPFSKLADSYKGKIEAKDIKSLNDRTTINDTIPTRDTLIIK